MRFEAGVAHLVERNLPKVEVAGSRPVARSNRDRAQSGGKTLGQIAKGDFEIKDWSEKPAGAPAGPKVTRATVTQKFTGDIKGVGTTEYLMVYRPDKTAQYSGVQIIKGSVGGKKGSLALRLRGEYDGKRALTAWEVVPRAGKGALKGMTGKGKYSAPHGSKGKYTLTYDV
jgi:hypothetical protein